MLHLMLINRIDIREPILSQNWKYEDSVVSQYFLYNLKFKGREIMSIPHI